MAGNIYTPLEMIERLVATPHASTPVCRGAENRLLELPRN